MHMVAPIWRVAALVIPLASLVGCDWLPVRRRIDPALYPVPARPDPALIRGHRKLLPGSSEESPHPTPTALAGMYDDRRLPPLPDLVPVSPDELFGPPAPTPMLDAALVRAQAIETAVFEDDATELTEPKQVMPERGDPVGEDHFLESLATDPSERSEPEDSPALPMPETVEVPPIAERLSSDLDQAETIELDEDREDDFARKTTEPIPILGTLETPDEEQRAVSQEHLLEEPGDQIVRGEDDLEFSTSYEHLLKRIAVAKVPGQTDDPSLWQTVMHLLAEPEPHPEVSKPFNDSLREDGRSFRVARIAFCREVVGFDQIKPYNAEALQAGQKVLIYSEVEGVHYLPESDGHVSQLSTTLEILDEGESPPLWSNVFPVEDRCSRPRHDYFVGYRLALPESLAPGRYRLRVVQRDLLSGLEDVAETPFVIVSEGR